MKTKHFLMVFCMGFIHSCATPPATNLLYTYAELDSGEVCLISVEEKTDIELHDVAVLNNFLHKKGVITVKGIRYATQERTADESQECRQLIEGWKEFKSNQ